MVSNATMTAKSNHACPARVLIVYSSLRHLLAHSLSFLLLSEHPPTHLQHRLKPFPPLLRVLFKTLHARLLDLRLDLLPSSTKRRDPRFLLKLRPLMTRLALALIRLVNHCFPYTNHVRPSKVCAAHGDFLRDRIDI